MPNQDPRQPRFGLTPLELLDSRNNDPHSLASYYGTRLFGALIGACLPLSWNWKHQRPFKAGE